MRGLVTGLRFCLSLLRPRLEIVAILRGVRRVVQLRLCVDLVKRERDANVDLRSRRLDGDNDELVQDELEVHFFHALPAVQNFAHGSHGPEGLLADVLVRSEPTQTNKHSNMDGEDDGEKREIKGSKINGKKWKWIS